jgi:two-component system NtrC family sensor kinase
MQSLLARLVGGRLQRILIISFALTSAITIALGSLITNSLINNYLEGAQDERVGRDMELANAFYQAKADDLTSSSSRVASIRSVRHNLPAAGQGQVDAMQVVEEAIQNEISNLPAGTQRFVVVTSAQGTSIAGKVASFEQVEDVQPGTDWSSLPILNRVLAESKPLAATEVLPAEMLGWLGLEQQAHIPLLDTPKAASKPFDPREGTAGLVLVSVAPVLDAEGSPIGSVLVGHLFNNDFSLVDRIKEVAGVDTVTIFFGDLRVSTNVPNEAGERAIGTRVSQEVFDQVLVGGEEFTGEAFVVNQNYITRYQPLYNHQGSVVGVLYVGAEQAAFQELVDDFRRRVLLISGATILLAILIAIPLARSITRPLTVLAAATRKVARGDWSVRVPVLGQRETSILARSFNTMVETLEEAQDQLVQQEKLASVGQLAAGVAHEINNPLGSVLLYADILRKETPDDDQQQKDDLGLIMAEATRCKTIVNDLLNFARQNEVLAQATNLNTLLQELVTEVGKQEVFQGIELLTDLAPELPSIEADPLQLRQVFLNLMKNAAEAMPDGGRLTLHTWKGPGPDSVTVEVQDTGTGISEENMKEIFTPFFTTKPIGKGTGLGLAIIYGIVKMHRGQIAVESEEGRGTTFTITLREQLVAQVDGSGGGMVRP